MTNLISIRGFAVVVILGLSAACGNDIARTTDPARLGTLAASVEKVSAGEADQLLADAGYDEASFRNVVEEIMEDSDRAMRFSKAYQAAAS